jgi:hypothetical protein
MRLLPTGRMQRGPVGLDELDRWGADPLGASAPQIRRGATWPRRAATRLLATEAPNLGPARLPVEYRRLLAELAARSTADGGLTQEQGVGSRAPAPDGRMGDPRVRGFGTVPRALHQSGQPQGAAALGSAGPAHRLRDTRYLVEKCPPRRARDGGRSRGVPSPRMVA